MIKLTEAELVESNTIKRTKMINLRTECGFSEAFNAARTHPDHPAASMMKIEMTEEELGQISRIQRLKMIRRRTGCTLKKGWEVAKSVPAATPRSVYPIDPLYKDIAKVLQDAMCSDGVKEEIATKLCSIFHNKSNFNHEEEFMAIVRSEDEDQS